MSKKNTDSKTIKREGYLDAESMKIEYKDEKTKTTYIYDISEPFKEYHEQEVLVTIKIDKVARPEKEITIDGDIS